MQSKSSQGNTIAEYLLIMGLVVVICIAALNLTGSSISNLLAGNVGSALGSGGSASNVMGILSPVQSPGGGQGGKSGIDPKTGRPYASANNSAGGTNATSVEGGSKSEQSFASAMFMESLAAQDPANADLILKMSKLMYLMGGVQGGYLENGSAKDGQLVLGSNIYKEVDAKYDLQQMQKKLNRMLDQLPMGSRAYGEASALVADANQVADSFLGNQVFTKRAGVYDNYEVNAQIGWVEKRADAALADNKVNNRHEQTFDDAGKAKGKRRNGG